MQRQGIVNFCGLRIVDRVGLYVCQRQFVANFGGIQFGKASALRKIVEQETLPMKIIGTGNGTCVLQKGQWRCLTAATGFYDGFVFGRIFVGPEQNFVQLIFDGDRALADHQVF